MTIYRKLRGPRSIGIKTLSPDDKDYVGWYDNDDKSSAATAGGYSYHNGPEWVHLTGKLLQCLQKLERHQEMNVILAQIQQFIQAQDSVNGQLPSLPELTQENG